MPGRATPVLKSHKVADLFTARRRRSGSGARSLLLLFALSLLTTSAHANTYLFSFTTAQLMTALQQSQGTALFNESAYFAIFVQPDPAQVSSYSYVTGSLTAPNPSDPNQWDTSVITDPTSPFLGYGTNTCTANCSWAGFYKDSSAPYVTVVSGANYGPGGSNIFVGNDWFDQGSAPFAWGGQDTDFNVLYDQYMNTVMPGSDVFSFQINTSQPLSGAITLKGSASALVSGSPTFMSGNTKDDGGLSFSLTVTPSPEPGTWASMLGGGLVFLGLLYLKKTRKNTEKGTQDPAVEMN